MKRITSLLFFLLLIITAIAQAPDKISYQAVIRNADGLVRANQIVNLQIGILRGSITGSSVFVETQTVTTSVLGIVNLIIGSGTIVSGSLQGINWASGPFFLKVWLDGSEMGTSQLLSVPYAKYAEKAGNVFSGNYIDLSNKPVGKNPGDILYWNDTSWVLLSAGLNGQVLTINNGVPGWTGAGGIPSIVTLRVYNIGSGSATVDANATNDGGSFITEKGICFSKSQNPVISNAHIAAGANPGPFTAVLSSLDQNASYYIRAYATNFSGTAYGNQLNFSTSTHDTTNIIKDIEGNQYDMVVIGTQTWFAQNLKVTKLNNSTPINVAVDTAAWNNGTNPKYCWMDGDSLSYKNPYGAIYNWYTVNTGNLCPTGWHVPSDDEWATLTTYLGGPGVTGGKLKEIGTSHWVSPNTGAADSYGFSAVPGGERGWEGYLSGIGNSASFWSSTVNDATSAWDRYLVFDNGSIVRENSSKTYGMSVRCIKN